MSSRVCAVVGIGPGNGTAFAKRFARDGFACALMSRSTDQSSALAAELPGARAFACDVGDAKSVERAFGEVRSTLGDPEVVIYNAGSGVFGSFDDLTAEQFESAWRVNAFGAFLVAKQVTAAMKQAGRGSFAGDSAMVRKCAPCADGRSPVNMLRCVGSVQHSLACARRK